MLEGFLLWLGLTTLACAFIVSREERITGDEILLAILIWPFILWVAVICATSLGFAKLMRKLWPED